MPAAVSKKQMRYMMAILHGKKDGTSARGDRVPKSVAAKYVGGKGAGDSTPESKGKEHEGGKWGEGHHAKNKKNVESKRLDRKKAKSEDREKKKSLKKSFEDFVLSQGRKAAGVLVVDDKGRFLLGRRSDNGLWATPGGKVDEDETHEEGALRELREEANVVGEDPKLLCGGMHNGFDTKTFLVTSFKGKPKNSPELLDLKWFYITDVPWDDTADYTSEAIGKYVKSQLNKSNKSIAELVIEENLQKNIMRSGNAPGNTVFEVTHGDALKVVGNGTFRMLRNAVKDMTDEDFRNIKVDQYTIHIRKHTNDVYSGRVDDGHKQVHQWTNKSLPQVAVELMSVFEWYLPEDSKELELLDESQLDDSAIEGGMQTLIDNYKKHNIGEIYAEIEHIRQEIRHGNAVDLQQVEAKIMKVFDKLEENLLSVVDKHNDLTRESGGAVDEIHAKLRELHDKIDGLSKQPVSVDAYSSAPKNDTQIHADLYPYLPKPVVEISPDGRIKITFGADWTAMERHSFLSDMKAKAVKRLDK